MTGQPFYLQFFNIQYWYCVIYSIFGGKCADVGSDAGVAPAQTVATGWSTPAAPAPAPTQSGDFFSWLFGANGAGVHHTGFFGPLFDMFAVVFAIVGIILGFIWALYSILAYLASLALLVIIIVSVVGLFAIRSEEALRYGNLPHASAIPRSRVDRWRPLIHGAMTTDPRQWKTGIITADQMLAELLGSRGYAGATTEEKLASVPESAFLSLAAAREAHAIAEKVSTPGADFILTQREAFRVMKLYEQVFDEFHFV